MTLAEMKLISREKQNKCEKLKNRNTSKNFLSELKNASKKWMLIKKSNNSKKLRNLLVIQSLPSIKDRSESKREKRKQ